MTVTALWMQNNASSAKDDRQLMYSIFTEGVLEGFAVTERAAGANFSVDVSAGHAVVQGDDSADQGSYVCSNDGVVNVALANPPGSGSRIDRIILQVRDPFAGGPSGNDVIPTVVTGTSAPSNPSPPALPASAITLATVTVAAGLPAVTNASGVVADARTFASVRFSGGAGGGGGGGGLTSVESFGSAYGLELLIGRDPGVETAVANWYEAGSLAAIAAETTIIRNGAASLRIRGTGAGAMTAGQKGGLSGVAVSAGATYQGSVYLRAFSQVRSCFARINWYNGAGSLISSTDGTAANDSNVAWTQYSAEGVAPALAVRADIKPVISATILNEDHFADDFSFHQKLVAESKIDFAAAYLIDDPANGRIIHQGEIASHLFMSRFFK